MFGASKQFRAIAQNRLGELRLRPYAELARMMGSTPDSITLGRRKGWLATVVEIVDGDTVQVVVQGSLKCRWVPGLSDWFADGFRINRGGGVMEVPDHVLRDFD